VDGERDGKENEDELGRIEQHSRKRSGASVGSDRGLLPQVLAGGMTIVEGRGSMWHAGWTLGNITPFHELMIPAWARRQPAKSISRWTRYGQAKRAVVEPPRSLPGRVT
jgi:hypothetical protein